MAQGTLGEFEQRFRDGVRAGAKADDPAEFAAALQMLTAAAERVPELPAERQGQARFWVDVRRAEVLWHSGDPDGARRVALEAQRVAAADPAVYRGYYRVLLLVLLWQSTPEEEFFARVAADADGDRAFLLAATTLADVDRRAPQLHVPLVMLCSAVLQRTGDSAGAFAALRELADRLAELPKVDPSWRAQCLEAVAMQYIARQELDRADIYLRGLGADEALYPRTLIAYRRGDLARAEALARALAQKRPVYCNVLGEILEEQGKWSDALEQYRTALREGQLEDIDRAVIRNSVGDCQLQLGDLDAAATSYEKALAMLDAAGGSLALKERGQMIMDLGVLAERRGDRVTARGHFVAALDAIEAARREIPLDPLGGAWLSGYYAGESIDGALRTAEDSPAGRWAALAATERAKARGLLDWIEQPPQIEDEARLRATLRELALTQDLAEVDARRRALDRARVVAQQVGARSARTLDAKELRDALTGDPPGSVFLSYWLGESTLWLFAQRRGEALQMLELASREDALARLAAAWRAVADPGPDPWPALDAAAELFVPEPVVALLDLRFQNRSFEPFLVVVSLGGELERLPFEALRVDGEPLFAMIERAPSLSVRAALARRDVLARDEERVVIVDSVKTPDEIAAQLRVAPLRFSAQEGDAVARWHGGRGGAVDGGRGRAVERLRGDDANLDQLAGTLAAAPASLLHVSAHAVASPLVPSRSLLLLADGPVSMASLATLSLRGATVVLSSCSSAAGEARGGEGMVGLLWGPMGAGARAVVGSLWAVNQESTAELMEQFHHELAQGRNEAAALAMARWQLRLSSRYAHPHYWAGFAAYGSTPFTAFTYVPREEPYSWFACYLALAGAAVAFVCFAMLRRLSRQSTAE